MYSDRGMKTGFTNQKQLPLVVEPYDASVPGRNGESLDHLCHHQGHHLRDKLLEHGALLLRGFIVPAPNKFAQFVRQFSGHEPLDYVGGASPRIKLGGGVYTSTEYSPHVSLSLHNELSYTYTWPACLFFFCAVAPERGGETLLGDSRALLRKIDAGVVHEFKSRMIRYDRNLSGDSGSNFSWQAAFETNDKSSVERYCRAGGVGLRWTECGGLRLSEVRSATARHPLTGDEVWFNQADGFHPSALDPADYAAFISCTAEEDFRLNSYFGDGAPLDLRALEHIREVMREEMVLVKWQEGDILIVDNMLAAHGRMPFTGPRKILLAMS